MSCSFILSSWFYSIHLFYSFNYIKLGTYTIKFTWKSTLYFENLYYWYTLHKHPHNKTSSRFKMQLKLTSLLTSALSYLLLQSKFHKKSNYIQSTVSGEYRFFIQSEYENLIIWKLVGPNTALFRSWALKINASSEKNYFKLTANIYVDTSYYKLEKRNIQFWIMA